MLHLCLNGVESDDPSWWEHDAQHIPLSRVCDKCRDEKLSHYRPEILSGQPRRRGRTDRGGLLMEATFNKNAMTLSIVIEDDDGNELDLALPAKFEVCGRCSGKGSHVNPSVDGHGISPEEFAEDPDFKEAYFSGMYDVTCYECGGERVMAVFDYSRMNDEQKECADRHERSEAYDDAERRSEERFGY